MSLVRRPGRFLWLPLAAIALATALGYAAWWPTSTLFGAAITVAPTPGERLRLALTFDDGPDPAVTPRVLDALGAAGAHATFFLIGDRVRAHPELVARIAAEGHSIGNHSLTHAMLPLYSSQAIHEELATTQALIATASGSRPRWFRPPHGLRDPRVLRVARELGLTTVLWSVSSHDWRESNPARVLERVVAGARDGRIVLLHDGDASGSRRRPHTKESLAALLRILDEHGFALVSLDEMLGPT